MLFLRRAAVLATVIFAVAVAGGAPAVAAPLADDAKQNCIYPRHQRSILGSFEAMIGREYDCVLVFNDASPDWAGWEDPWYEHHPDPNLNWAKWVKEKPGRRLIVTQNLFPSEVNNTNWRPAGAAGAYTEHARAL